MGVAHNPQEAVIETRQLYKRFGQVTALENINICIHRGEFVAIMGASGSGKTTLMNILTCLDTVTEGQVLLDGVDDAAHEEIARDPTDLGTSRDRRLLFYPTAREGRYSCADP